MAKYTVRSPIKSGGRIHDIGDTITLADEVAAPLLVQGRIEAIAAKNSSDDAGAAHSGDAAREAAESKAPAAAAGKPDPAKKHGAKK